jgi:hypothetical protein
MKKCILTLLLTGIFASAMVNAKTNEQEKNGVNVESAKPVKKHKKKKYSNKVVNKSKRNWYKL